MMRERKRPTRKHTRNPSVGRKRNPSAPNTYPPERPRFVLVSARVAVFCVARTAFCLLGRWPRRVFVYLFGDAETRVSETRWIRGGLESFYSQTDDVLHFDVGAKHLIFCEKILLSFQSKFFWNAFQICKMKSFSLAQVTLFLRDYAKI
jgi:hypothetical protein